VVNQQRVGQNLKLKQMAKQLQVSSYKKPTVSRKGIHAKSKTSVSKSSANYKKPYKGQGK